MHLSDRPPGATGKTAMASAQEISPAADETPPRRRRRAKRIRTRWDADEATESFDRCEEVGGKSIRGSIEQQTPALFVTALPLRAVAILLRPHAQGDLS